MFCAQGYAIIRFKVVQDSMSLFDVRCPGVFGRRGFKIAQDRSIPFKVLQYRSFKSFNRELSGNGFVSLLIFPSFFCVEKTFLFCVFHLVSLSGDCTFNLLKYKTGLQAIVQTCCPAMKVARGTGEQVGGGGA